jgi:transglutaminase-like putative cysteine protease
MDKAQETFAQWLDRHRMQTVAEVFHEIIERTQPPSASGEREAFEHHARACDLRRDEDEPDEYRNQAVQEYWRGWQARSALAPSPGIDAAGQKPVQFDNDGAWALAQKVRAALDRKACPGVFMDVAMEAIGRHYAATPAAQPSADDWKEAMDAELVSMESTADSYATPREAVRALIDWNVAVATDPAVNGKAPSAEWLSEAERLVCKYGDECHETASTGFIAKMVVARAALFAHLRTKGDANG